MNYEHTNLEMTINKQALLCTHRDRDREIKKKQNTNPKQTGERKINNSSSTAAKALLTSDRKEKKKPNQQHYHSSKFISFYFDSNNSKKKS